FARINQAINRGELALAQAHYATARESFLRAEGFLRPTGPAYTRDFVNAGVGLAALAMGDLAEARAREAALRACTDVSWYDPTTVVQFRARMLERRGRSHEARTLLEHTATKVRGRLVLAWVKIQ